MPTAIGIIGCGDIFRKAYAPGIRDHFDALELGPIADIDHERAKSVAKDVGTTACTVQELLANDAIRFVCNLTTPQHHAQVNEALLEAGKHLYVEKPFALDRAQGQAVIELAKAKNLRVSSAPDTFLGGGLQTCRMLVDNGAIGRPISATAFMGCPGHESWHPSPEFYYLKGGGPLFDMGPYYITALVSILGPVKHVSGFCTQAFSERTIGSEAKRGQVMSVEVATHVAGTLAFANGCIATLITSFDIHKHHMPRLELHGSEGSLSMPDPNTFDGPVELARRGQDWQHYPLTHAVNCRGAGIADLVEATISNRPHRASGELAMHVLDIMQSLQESGESKQTMAIASSCEKPEPVPAWLPEGCLKEAESVL